MLGAQTAAFLVSGGLPFAGEGLEAQRGGGFTVGHWASKWLSWDGNPVCLTPELEPVPFMGDHQTLGDLLLS